MDKATIEMILADKLTLNETRVLLAMSLGHVDIYDIQQATGLKRYKVEEVLSAQNGQRILRIHCSGSQRSIVALATPAQNGQTPPLRLVIGLYSSLNRTWVSNTREYSAAKRIYQTCYAASGNDQTKALVLVQDIVASNLDSLTRSVWPALYLQRLVKVYLASLPAKPKLVREQEQLTGIRQRWNNV